MSGRERQMVGFAVCVCVQLVLPFFSQTRMPNHWRHPSLLVYQVWRATECVSCEAWTWCRLQVICVSMNIPTQGGRALVCGHWVYMHDIANIAVYQVWVGLGTQPSGRPVARPPGESGMYCFASPPVSTGAQVRRQDWRRERETDRLKDPWVEDLFHTMGLDRNGRSVVACLADRESLLCFYSRTPMLVWTGG